jgi:hypothetical protein
MSVFEVSLKRLRESIMRKKQQEGSDELKSASSVNVAPPAQRLESLLVQKARQSNHDWANRTHPRKAGFPASTAWKRQTWTLPREEARLKAREFLRKYPRAAYWSEVETWRVLPDNRIEFTMRRLPTAD